MPPATDPIAARPNLPSLAPPDLHPGGAFRYSGDMSVIVAEVYDALLEAGASEPKAKAAAAAIPTVTDFATQQDVAALRQDIAALKQDVAALRQDIAVVKFAVFTFGPIILALLVKLVFFP